MVAMLEEKGFLDFNAYFENQTSFDEALLAFFCLLHLIKNRVVMAVQENLFGSIQVWLRPEEAA